MSFQDRQDNYSPPLQRLYGPRISSPRRDVSRSFSSKSNATMGKDPKKIENIYNRGAILLHNRNNLEAPTEHSIRRIKLPVEFSPMSSSTDDSENFKKCLSKYGVHEEQASLRFDFGDASNRLKKQLTTSLVELPPTLAPISPENSDPSNFQRCLEKYGVQEEAQSETPDGLRQLAKRLSGFGAMRFHEKSKGKKMDDLEAEYSSIISQARSLFLRLPSQDDKIKVAMWIAKINNAPDFELRYQYAKLLLTILEEGVLLGPFVDEPPADLQPLPEEYSAPNIVEVLREQKERQGGSGDRPPVLTEVSSDLKEYAAAQLIPKFGVHCYYAVSDEPLPEWRQAGDAGQVSSAASAALPCDRPRTECDSDEVHRADCSLCAVTGSVLDEDETDFQWMEGRPQQYYTPLGTERGQVTPPYFPGTPISPTSPLRASPGRPLSPASRLPRGPITSSPIAQQFRSPTTRTPHLEGPTSPETTWFSAIEGLMLPSISDLSSTGAYGTPFTLPTLDSTTRPPVIPAGDMSGRGPMLPFESGLSSLESSGTPLASLQQTTPPTSGTTTPSLPSSCRSPHSGFSRSPASAGAAHSTPSGTPAVSPISPASYSPRAAVKAEPVDYPPSEQGHRSGYRVQQEQVFKESPSARGLPPGPSLRESPCDTGCSTTPQQQAAAAVASRPSPYTSHVPTYGRTAELQPRIGEESLFPDLFGQEQPPQETIMSVVRRLRQQQAEGRERCRVYKAEIEASNRRREQILAMRSRTPRTQAPTAAPMPSPHVAHPSPQPQQTPISRPVNRDWPTTLPQFPDLFGQGPTESPIVQIARRLQQQNEETRERTRRRVAHREQRVRDRELMLQQATGETLRSRREPPEAAPTVRFKKEEQPSAPQLVEECVEECTEEAESPESSPQAATEESSPETSYEFPPPIWSSRTRAEHQFVPSRGYGEARYHTPTYRSPRVKTEESSPESGYEFAPSAWPSSRTDGHAYVSTPVYGEDRYQTTSQRGCEAPCGAESSESSPEPPLPPPLWSSARRDRSGPARRPPPGANWDTY